MTDYTTDPRFTGIQPLQRKCWLSSPTMHDDELRWVGEAIKTNWVSTLGANIDEVERIGRELIGRRHAVALSSGTAALHLAIRLCAEKLYGRPPVSHGSLEGKHVFCSDMTFSATANPVCYEGGIPVFIDAEYDSWNMDPAALEKAFSKHPEVRLVVIAHLYGTLGKIDELQQICDSHGALIVEDAAEALGSTYKGMQAGTFGTASVISFNGNKIITGSSGGMLLTDSVEDAAKARKWSMQAREDVPWYQHEELGYNYRMSNVIAGVVRGQFPHLEEHVEQKRTIYKRYMEGLADLPVTMNPIPECCAPNHWLSCMLIDEEAHIQLKSEPGKSCPGEILAALEAFGAEGRPVWKPMHMQPFFRNNEFVTKNGCGTVSSDAHATGGFVDVGLDIFRRGLCLPSDNKMTKEQQNSIIEIIHRCFVL